MSLLTRIKVWSPTEDVTAADLNAEFDNILNNMTPQYVGSWSANVAQMQQDVSPGSIGSESLATSLAEEIKRLRYMIRQSTGMAQWYSVPAVSLSNLASAFGTSLVNNRIVSGRVSATSQQPMFLVPNGTSSGVSVKGASTNLIYYVNGTQYTIATDVALAGLTTAPTSQNTCTVNDANASGQWWTANTGEDGSSIPVTSMGTNISNLVGKLAAFKLNNGVTNEYFIAFVESTTKLSKAYRGFFFNSADAAIPRLTYSNTNVITLMQLTWVFAKTDGTLTATYNNPIWSKTQPNSPAIGDYWFDTSTNQWKIYQIGGYVSAGASLIGICIQDGTNTVAARSFPYFAAFSSLNTVELKYESTTQVRTASPNSQISVNGALLKFDFGFRLWDITLNLEAGVTRSASTYYYFYVTETGDLMISDKKPHDRNGDLQGYYHPHQTWRCIGSAYSDGSQNLVAVNSFYHARPAIDILPAQTASADVSAKSQAILLDTTGGAVTQYLPPAVDMRGQTLRFIKTNSGANLATLTAFGADLINGAATFPLANQNQVVDLLSDGTNWYLAHQQRGHCVASYGITSGPTLASGAIINFPVKYTDTHSAVTTGASWKFTVPVGMGGLFEAKVAIAAINTNYSNDDQLYIYLRKNGSVVRRIALYSAYNTPQSRPHWEGSCIVDAVDGDYFDFFYSAASASSISLTAAAEEDYCSITKVG